MSDRLLTLSDGERIFKDGWRQCTLFSPSPDSVGNLPDYLEFDQSCEYLVVCTQSCSVCSEDFRKDPFVEVMVANVVTLTKQNAQMSTGQNIRRLIVRAAGESLVGHIACDINRRAFIPRQTLLSCSPHDVQIHKDDAKAFQGWMAQYYARAALPNELGRRLRASGLLEAFKSVLKTKSGLTEEMHRGVDRLYIYWDAKEASDSGSEELEADLFYRLHVIVACKHPAAQEQIERALSQKSSLEQSSLDKYGIKMNQPLVETLDQITLEKTIGYTRLNDWDYLSGMAELASTSQQD